MPYQAATRKHPKLLELYSIHTQQTVPNPSRGTPCQQCRHNQQTEATSLPAD